jgi:hypothetical protein
MTADSSMFIYVHLLILAAENTPSSDKSAFHPSALPLDVLHSIDNRHRSDTKSASITPLIFLSPLILYSANSEPRWFVKKRGYLIRISYEIT